LPLPADDVDGRTGTLTRNARCTDCSTARLTERLRLGEAWRTAALVDEYPTTVDPEPPPKAESEGCLVRPFGRQMASGS